MKLAMISLKNLRRHRFRTFATMSGVAVAVLAFLMLRTVIWAWGAAAEYGAQDRVATRHKVTFVMQIPKLYVDEIRQVPKVKAVTWANWFGAKYAANEHEFFASFAVDAPTYLDVYDEVVVPPEQKQEWLADRQGALVGDVLAKKFGWKIGDTVTLTGTIYPGEWTFHVRGIYTATRKSFDRSSFLFHWNYMNDSLPERRRDKVGWTVARIGNAAESADVSQAIDKRFDDRDIQTISMSEQALNASFMGMMSAVLDAIDVVSIVILAIMALILGNTIAMGVRERTREYGVMLALGFRGPHIAGAVLGESALVGLIGGAIGLALSFPFVNQGLGRWLEENMGAWFPYFRIQNGTAVLALGLSVLLGLCAAALPAWRASRLNVTTALRHVG